MSKLLTVLRLLAGVLLISGVQARLGALLAIATMFGAVFAHVRYDWTDEPPVLLPVMIVVLAAMVLLRGPGDPVLVRRSRERN